MNRLPDDPKAFVVPEDLIVRNDGDLFRECYRDQHAVEWVVIMKWKSKQFLRNAQLLAVKHSDSSRRLAFHAHRQGSILARFWLVSRTVEPGIYLA